MPYLESVECPERHEKVSSSFVLLYKGHLGRKGGSEGARTNLR